MASFLGWSNPAMSLLGTLTIDTEIRQEVAHSRAGVEGSYGITLTWDEMELWTIGKGEGLSDQNGFHGSAMETKRWQNGIELKLS